VLDSAIMSYMNAQRESASLWFATHYEWRHESEHTIMGKHMDLELQIFHKPGFIRYDIPREDQLEESVLAVLFSMDPVTLALTN